MKRLGYKLAVAMLAMGVGQSYASDHETRVSLGAGLLYERGCDLTLSVEHETRYHSAWEYFGNVYLKWKECPSCGHICPDSFWHSYNSWGVGVAYKPCVIRTRNTNGNLRIGASLGSDTHEVLGGVHVGYEHNYRLRNGVVLFWQVKSDMMINGKDLFRTGAVVGVKCGI